MRMMKKACYPALRGSVGPAVPRFSLPTPLGGTVMALTWPLERQGSPSPTIDAVEPIKTVQHLLRHHGHDIVVDGIFGPITAAAVRSFQQSRGLLVDGIVGNQTWPALIVEVSSGREGEAVRAVQSQLNARDLSGDPSRLLQVDGIFGPKTDAAVRSFQAASGQFGLEPPLVEDGIVGPLTWNALVNALEIIG